ncbi:related to pisatin demethylase (cytochrome P450) [Phialocephala subalpina]|uniref:Related to pisatin demethylase (Cytochrome P450) n=1 Tax=Phialocephala subalpina TaxID=576137 RepID=A0A1L7X6L3_9HELO|nr:related to pisatin demethylase (cytochrome P450) [Phialocephala subalpina]
MAALDSVSASLSIFVIVAAGIATHLFYSWYRLSHIPGPFWPSISKYWMVKKALEGKTFSSLKEVTDRYGSLARVGPNDLVTDDPDILRRMMAVRSPYTRGPWYDAMRLDPMKDNLLSMRDEEAHTALRNKMAAGVRMTFPLWDIQAHKTAVLGKRERSKESRIMDLGEKGQFFTLDVISDLAFGKPFGYLAQDCDPFDYIKITEQYIPAMLVMANLPWLARLTHTRLFASAFPKESDKLGFGAFIGLTSSRIANNIVKQRFLPGADIQKDMMASFIRHGLTTDEASSEALLQIIAGSDTSAATIRVLLLNIMSSLPIYRRLQAEIDTASKSGKSPVQSRTTKPDNYPTCKQ